VGVVTLGSEIFNRSGSGDIESGLDDCGLYTGGIALGDEKIPVST
jgi:hypothetical protein